MLRCDCQLVRSTNHHHMKLLPFLQGLLTSLCLFSFTGLFAAEASFKAAADTVKRSARDVAIRAYTIEAKGMTDAAGTTVKVVADVGLSTVAPSTYSIKADFQPIAANATSQELLFHVHFKEDPLPNRELKLVLKIVLEVNGKEVGNVGAATQLAIVVKGVETPLSGYNYLAYIGTNFDLVDGPKPKNLFFATNIFLPSEKPQLGLGLYLSLYGNRTVSSIDSSSNTRRLARIEPKTDTTSTYIYENADRVTTFSSDNLGAHVSPLLNMGACSDPGNKLRLMFAPSLSVVWRRITSTTSYSNGTAADTMVRDVSFPSSVEVPEEMTITRSQWDLRYGVGVFVSHETRALSMRLYGSYGLCTVYNPTSGSSNGIITERYVSKPERFFAMSAWITHAGSGLTLQAEFSNIITDPRPFYGVTLSKALDFDNLSSVFKPLAGRQ